MLRVRVGDEVVLFNGEGGEFRARVSSLEKRSFAVEVLERHGVERELPFKVILIQGVSSGERMEFTIRKAVELGVAEVHPVLARASVARPKGERAASRQAHWQKIALSACEQCGRNRIPVVHPLQDLSVLKQLEQGAQRILLSPRGENPFSKCLRAARSYVVAAGPEAGFDEREEAAFKEAGFAAAKLGSRVLRTETAALAALAALNALRGDF